MIHEYLAVFCVFDTFSNKLVYLDSSNSHYSNKITMYLESRRGQIASISSIKITEGFPNLICEDASAKASRKTFSLSPAFAL